MHGKLVDCNNNREKGMGLKFEWTADCYWTDIVEIVLNFTTLLYQHKFESL